MAAEVLKIGNPYVIQTQPTLTRETMHGFAASYLDGADDSRLSLTTATALYGLLRRHVCRMNPISS